jgi:hypothetical protein
MSMRKTYFEAVPRFLIDADAFARDLGRPSFT